MPTLERTVAARIESRRVSARGGRPAHWRSFSASFPVRAIAYPMALDCAMLFGSFAVAVQLRGPVDHGDNWLLFALTLLPVYLLIAVSLHAYSTDTLEKPFRAIRKSGQSLLLSIAALTFGGVLPAIGGRLLPPYDRGRVNLRGGDGLGGALPPPFVYPDTGEILAA